MAEPSIEDRIVGSPALRRHQALGRSITRSLGRVRVLDLDAVAPSGPVLLAANHRSLLDGVLLFGWVRRPVSCLVKAEAFTPRLGRLLLSAGQVPVRRDVVDARAVRLCLRILRTGGVVGIFPEGTRGAGLVETAKPGVGYLALRAGATVIPVACAGTPELAHRRTWRRPSAVVLFGAPIAVDRWPDHNPLNRGVVAATTERIRVELAALVAVADEVRAVGARGSLALAGTAAVR